MCLCAYMLLPLTQLMLVHTNAALPHTNFKVRQGAN